jgi:glutathione reductase (NADPH)
MCGCLWLTRRVASEKGEQLAHGICASCSIGLAATIAARRVDDIMQSRFMQVLSRFIVVDEFSKTSVDSIYAIGDITNRVALTPVALMEGGAVAHTLFNDCPTKPSYEFVPTAVFSQPHIGTCGYSEAAAVDKYSDVDVFTSSFKPMRNSFAGNDVRGFYKIIVDATSDRVVGMHCVGPDSGEIMQVRPVSVQA